MLEGDKVDGLNTVTDIMPIVELTSTQVGNSAVGLETPSMTVAFSTHEPNNTEYHFAQFTSTPVSLCISPMENSHHKLIKDCDEWLAEDIQQKDTSPQLSHRQKTDQYTQASDAQQLKELVTNLEQVIQKMMTFVFGKGIASVEGKDILKEAVHTNLGLSPPQTTNGNFMAQFSQAQVENRSCGIS